MSFSVPLKFLFHLSLSLYLARQVSCSTKTVTGIDDMSLLDSYPTFIFSTNTGNPTTYVISEWGTSERPFLTTAVGSYARKFIIVKGLSGAAGTISFRSVKNSNAYLLTNSWSEDLDFESNTGTANFRSCASFYERDALDGSSAVSYESQQKPGYFIRHESFGTRMKVSPFTSSGYFTRDATWDPRILARFMPYLSSSLRVNAKSIGGAQRAYLSNTYVMEYMIVPPLSGTAGAISIQSLRQNTYFLAHSASQEVICLLQRESSESYELNASFYMRPALNGRNGVSFESVKSPGTFIGLKKMDGWETLKLLPKLNTDQFKNEATFIITT